MGANCVRRDCPECGDTLIHLTNRGEHESSSAFGQFIHDNGERERAWREMYWLDIDGVIFKLRNTMLRVIEHKPMLGTLSASQTAVLPLLAKAIQLLAATGLVHKQSGVFTVNSDRPHDVVVVTQVKGWRSISVMESTRFTGAVLKRFLQGEELTAEDLKEHPGGD